MQLNEVDKLKHIKKIASTYYVPINVLRGFLPPIIFNNELLNYATIINICLKTPNISTKTFPLLALDPFSAKIQKTKLNQLSIQQAQEIIDNNYTLFSQLTNLIKENDLIEQLK